MRAKFRFTAGLPCVFLLTAPFSALAASTTITGATGLTVSVDPSGAYDIYLQSPAWHLGGNIGAGLSNLSVTTGIDGAGNYNQVSFDFKTDVARHASIRAYWTRPAVIFTLNWPVAGVNDFSFPNLKTYPAGLNHVGYSGVFANPTFTSLTEEGPWAFFDPAANTFILSPAANFMVTSESQQTDGTLSVGIDSAIPTLPQGFTHQTLLVAEPGINRAFDTWGQILRGLSGKTKPASDADASLKVLGYWTDNGSTYYYHSAPTLSYTDTLSGVKADFASHNIPLGYIQLDSWFYPKGPSADWTDAADGFYQYQAAPALFGSNLSGFQMNIGVPLITHARWIDPSSPYRQQYLMSNNVSIDPAYWQYVSAYLKNSGVVTYEQDWLVGPAIPNFNLTDANAFLGNMAAYMAAQGLTMQYCMPTPRHLMQSSLYKNLTTIRGSNDRFNPDHWFPFLYASRVIDSVGAWPFTDVFMSSERSNLLLATLSAGPVGIGDAIGSLNPNNIFHSIRADGAVVKPDAPIMPIDASYLNDAQSLGAPLIASAYTAFGDVKTYYVYAYPEGANTQAQFTLADLGLSDKAYIYDYFSGSGRLVDTKETYTQAISGDSLYLVAAPVGKSGMAVIGDTDQYVTVGKQRIPSFEDNGRIHMTVAFANGETSRRIEGYAPSAPKALAATGSVDQFTYNPSTHRFSFTVSPGPDGAAATLVIARSALQAASAK